MIRSTTDSVKRTRRMVADAMREAMQLESLEIDLGSAADVDSPDLPAIPGYQIIEEIHRGGQGVVYRAKSEDDATQVAIKVVTFTGGSSASQQRRFEREIDLLRRLDHPGIVPILDYGVADDRHFIVMPLIDGQPLDTASDTHGWTIAERAQRFARVAEIVEAAHRIGVIHRDLKPSNVLVDQQGDVHLIDFGLATQHYEGEGSEVPPGTTVTMTGQFIGSLPWSSPEHASCDTSRIDVRSDIYSLGVMLYQLVTGVLPHSAEGGPLALLDRIQNEPPEPPRSLDSRIPKDLETIILTCLQRDPDRRYQSAGQLRADLNRWLAGQAIEARRDSTLYVVSQTMKKDKFASSMVAPSWGGGLLLGLAMAMLYQQAAAEVADKESENQQLATDNAQLKTRVMQLKLGAMNADDGWAFMEKTWGTLNTIDEKEQFLSIVASSGHTFTHKGLHLGVQDPSPKIQLCAIDAASSIALFEVAEDLERYAAWYAEYEGQTLDNVLAASLHRMAKEIESARQQQDYRRLSMHLRCVDDMYDVRDGELSEAIETAVVESGLAISIIEIIEEGTGDYGPSDIHRNAREAIRRLPLEDAFVQQHVVPLLENVNSYQIGAATSLIERVKADWATDALMNCIVRLDPADRGSPISAVAGALAEQESYRAIPTMIAVIESDNTYETVNGVGYFGLGKLTGVKYDESHDGAWWRAWWQKNYQRFNLSDADAEIPIVKRARSMRIADDDKMARYFLHRSGKTQLEPPDAGYKLLFILPGGSGGVNFRTFCKSISQNSTDQTFLVVQLIAPVWDKAQAEKLVWPTRTKGYPSARFASEDLVAMVLKDIRQEHPIDDKHIYTLSWSSGGPAGYAISLAEDLPIAGSLIAMSVYKPQQLPPADAAKGKSYYLLHSPSDRIGMQFPKNAQRQLEAAGARVKLQTYEGGHGWHGDIFGNIRRGVAWLQNGEKKVDK